MSTSFRKHGFITKLKEENKTGENWEDFLFFVLFLLASTIDKLKKMWHDYLAYLIIAAAVFYLVRQGYLVLRHPEKHSSCASCTADCKLKGMKRPSQAEKRQNCTKKVEKSRK